MSFTFGTLAALQPGASLLLRGTSLGATPGAGVASIFGGGPLAGIYPATFTSLNLTGGALYDGSNQISIRADIVADSSATGLGTGFAT